MKHDTVEDIVDLIKFVRAWDDHIYVMGNGGSSAIAAHFVCDLMRTAGCRAHDLSCNSAVMTSYANDIGYENVFVEQLKVLTNQGDLVIVISGSGNSPNVVKAVEWAKAQSALHTVGFLGFDGGKLKTLLNYYIHFNNHDMQDVENQFAKLAHDIVELLK